ncbi:MAG TPA: hypothetical protein VKI65_04675 [Gemmataceae bacterium]|nr:hypothetical protein [Gemmataceae bacterium]
MTFTIPAELEQELQAQAQHRQMHLEDIVREALTWYVRMGSATIDELTAWQEIRDEALRLVEEPQP